jgi:MFS family permease
MMARNSLRNFVNALNPYNSIYIKNLGASETQIGMLTAISSGFGALLAMITGWIADRRDKKVIYLFGAFLGLFVPLIYFVTDLWIWLICAFTLEGIRIGVILPAWSAMYANSIENSVRGTVYGIANTLTILPTIIAPLIGGLVVTQFGGLTVDGIRPLYLIQFITLLLTWIYVFKFLQRERTESKPDNKLSLAMFLRDYKEIVVIKGAKTWLMMKMLGAVSVGLAGPFWILYAATILHASSITIAFMVTSRLLVNLIFSPFLGRLVDKFSRKKLIVTARFIMFGAVIIFLLSSGDPSIMIGSWAIWGIANACFVAWDVQMIEMVPNSSRARWIAMDHAAFHLLSVPAAIIGGYLWETVGPISPFLLMILVDGGLRMPMIYFGIPETARKPQDKQLVE